MGGAIAIHIASSALLPNILIVSAIDVVEGSAMASLNVMHQFLRERPQTFVSIEKAIEYCMKNRVTSNLRAARGFLFNFLFKFWRKSLYFLYYFLISSLNIRNLIFLPFSFNAFSTYLL